MEKEQDTTVVFNTESTVQQIQAIAAVFVRTY